MIDAPDLFADLPVVEKKQAGDPATPCLCVACEAETPHLFKGVRYCAEHHPDPGPHIKRARLAS